MKLGRRVGSFGEGDLFSIFVGPLQRVRPRNGILALGLVPLRSEFIGEL